MVSRVPSGIGIFQFPHLYFPARPHPGARAAEMLEIENEAELTRHEHDETQWVAL